MQCAVYSTLAQLAKKCPFINNQGMKIVFSYFNHLKNAPPELHGSIREALIAIASSFAFNVKDSKESFTLHPQLILLLAMLKDNIESGHLVVLNATFQFLTICFPPFYAPTRLLLLIIAGKRNALYEAIISSLYGCSKKDNLNYDTITSIDNKKLSSTKIVLSSFKEIVSHVYEVIEKRKNVTQNGLRMPFENNTFDEVRLSI